MYDQLGLADGIRSGPNAEGRFAQAGRGIHIHKFRDHHAH